MPKLYFASPLFTEMEVAFNAQLATRIRQHFPEMDVFLPQEQMAINDKNAYADAKMIAQYDTQAVLKSDVVLAILDGQIIDPGVASEIGVAYQAGIPVIGLYTDVRQQGGTHPQKIAALQEICESQFSYVNLYTVGLIKLNGEIVNSSDQVCAAIERVLQK
ncbi:nucleoside 2-deoxyribosyltransferase [Aerococcaceae bacterium NML201209]|nr:nucleoside 2-deoxyribosyltransferase [Aerococcaceae bacterium NML201209]MCW6664015.1 nucleoside 2-deoxyribosyltransferase [Aerococcaceae bacterium NML190073]MCW6666206.1 nucleoside 2-deoxyribosyltransferase [Aerococcaceae bacterium NML190938]MCW6674845.1 nucleoside 2-deoxyribosyltransferase [Aerococcaceae bacterium NML171108]MCW6683166.1 nucleoside 2-deoxyribosyltransferase [Aerococcaceae bacterium NML160702]